MTQLHRLRIPALATVLSLLLAACSSDSPTDLGKNDPSDTTSNPVYATVTVCHTGSSGREPTEIHLSDLSQHLGHGDYITTTFVDPASTSIGDAIHFARITDALSAAAAARTAHAESESDMCRITIEVSEGTYEGTASVPAPEGVEQFPLIVDVPNITLEGTLLMEPDMNGRPSGEPASPASVLTAVDPLPIIDDVSIPIIIANGHPGGTSGDGLVVKGFSFESGQDPDGGPGGQAILAVRVKGLHIEGNSFGAGFTESIDLRASDAELVNNYLSGTAGSCDICLAGPGEYLAQANKLEAGGIPGITVDGPVGLPVPEGIEPFELPSTAETRAVLENNEIRDHLRVPVGVGIRVDALGVGGPNVLSHVHARIHDNVLVNNRFGIIIHAAFPVEGTALHAGVDVDVAGNTIEESCEAKLLVSLSRHQTALGLRELPYLRNSTFIIDLDETLPWSDVWYSHPAGYGNTLVVNGETVANGARQFYDPEGCPGS